MGPPAQEAAYTPIVHEEPEEESVEQNPTVSGSPSLRSTAPSSPPPTLKTPSQKVDYSNDPISLENRSESAEVNESQGTRPHASPKEMPQHPPLGADDDHSGSDSVSVENLGWSVEMDEGTSATSHPSSGEISPGLPSHTDYDHSESHTNPKETLGGGGTLREDISDEGSGELSVRNLVFSVTEIGVGSDDSDEESDWSEMQQDNSEASGTLFVPILSTRTLHGWRFSFGYR